MEKAYKFRIYPNKEQEILIKKTFGCVRFVFNCFLAKRKELYETSGMTPDYNECSANLTCLKKELTWLQEVDSIALQSSLKDLDQAYQNFFRRVKNGETPGFPKFKSKRNHRKSYRTKNVNGNIQVSEKHIKLPKLGSVKAAVSKQVQGRILNVTVSQNPAGKYFASVCCADVKIVPYKSTGAAVGIDLGLKSIAVTSDQAVYENHKYLSKSEKKLVRQQRRLSGRQIGSKNREKQRVKVAKVHEKIANQRLEGIHNMTAQIVKNYDVICIEDLNIRGMVRNHRLAKAVSDASWGEIRRQLSYKSEWQHKALVVVDRFYPSSQLCGCGHKNQAVKGLAVRYWTCPVCGTYHDRDINAAENILNEGLRLLKAS